MGQRAPVMRYRVQQTPGESQERRLRATAPTRPGCPVVVLSFSLLKRGSILASGLWWILVGANGSVSVWICATLAVPPGSWSAAIVAPRQARFVLSQLLARDDKGNGPRPLPLLPFAHLERYVAVVEADQFCGAGGCKSSPATALPSGHA